MIVEEFSRQSTELHKKDKQYRLAQRQAKQREEDLCVTQEAITYKAGGFVKTAVQSG